MSDAVIGAIGAICAALGAAFLALDRPGRRRKEIADLTQQHADIKDHDPATARALMRTIVRRNRAYIERNRWLRVCVVIAIVAGLFEMASICYGTWLPREHTRLLSNRNVIVDKYKAGFNRAPLARQNHLLSLEHSYDKWLERNERLQHDCNVAVNVSFFTMDSLIVLGFILVTIHDSRLKRLYR